ncbi:helix-turn-helix transcriptional regulator [Halobacillus sp. Marseille-P3879]|uniref:helix-turn-helix domain-containing protein n=1 Tax=Halobacillus sp. Marseille-P3879 TaxID=2045014 RepID=UPI000C7C4E73|nr:helix-turn-helix domain-containing protein [Halobacillus sp. Marseille-P3879]
MAIKRKPTSIMPCYKPFEHTLINKGIKKQTLRDELGISGATFSKMKRNESLNIDTIGLIYEYLECESIEEIVRFVPIEPEESPSK